MPRHHATDTGIRSRDVQLFRPSSSNYVESVSIPAPMALICSYNVYIRYRRLATYAIELCTHVMVYPIKHFALEIRVSGLAVLYRMQ